ncbi:MAG TPA: phosphatase PAP2 family protein [Acidobacteriaceae bacterium]|nr:phosphatase PAP2 family protein [Acidobacteriaceae bacterium]
MMRSCSILAGWILIGVTTMCSHAQSASLPANPQPDFSQEQVAGLIPTSLASNRTVVESSSDTDIFASNSSAKPDASAQETQTLCGITKLGRCLRDLGEDEKAIFTSPLRLQPKDGYWLAPLGAATGLAIAYDADASQAVGVDPSRTNTANTIADFGSFWATGAEGAGIYFIGLAKKNPKLAETGRLADEAIIDSGTVTLVTKLASNRQRPRQGNGQGDFWAFGTQHWEWDSSFPSDHATATMALARVIAGEYPHWYVMAPAYGFAETISMARIFANQHFPSDILVGQAVGFLTGSYVLNHRSLYRPGAKKTLASKLIGSVNPIADVRTRTLGASMEIPIGR